MDNQQLGHNRLFQRTIKERYGARHHTTGNKNMINGDALHLTKRLVGCAVVIRKSCGDMILFYKAISSEIGWNIFFKSRTFLSVESKTVGLNPILKLTICIYYYV